MQIFRSTVFLILELCLFSALAAEILPQAEMRELDIFMQEEEHQEITRAKRTDEDIQEGEYSGDAPLPEQDPVSKTDDNVAEDESNQENSTNTPPSENPDMNPEIITSPSAIVAPESATDLPAIENNANPDISKIPPIDVSTSDTLLEQVNKTDLSVMENTAIGSNSTDTIDNAELAPPIIESRSGVPKDNTSEIETTLDTTEVNLPEIGRAVFSPDTSIRLDGVQDTTLNSNTSISENATDIASTNATLNNTQNTTNPPPHSISPDSSGNATVNSTIPTNGTITGNTTDNIPPSNATNTSNNTVTDSGTAKVNSTSTKSTEVAPTKPVIENSDQTKKESASGSGVLTTIIILLVLAALAAIGYVIYKKRSKGYSPVNVIEDNGKEMNEIENGFGKPIRDDEIRIQDQLTPTQPMASPRTFMTPPTEKKLNDVDMKTNKDRHTVEENIEIEEESKKADEYK